MARLGIFNRKSKASKDSAAQPRPQKSTSLATTIQQGSVALTTTSTAVSSTNQEISLEEGGKGLRDLWQEALDNLEEEKKSALKIRVDGNGQVQPCVTDAIQEVVASIEASFEEYNNGGSKTKDRNGKIHFSVHENGKKILRFALRSKAIIDAGVIFDPTGYSSSAWTIISLGLQFAQNDQDRLSAVFDASAFLADILHRYANIEANYRNQDVPSLMMLEDRLRSSYEAILNYVALVEQERCQKFWGRVWYSLYSLSEQPLQQLKDNLLDADNSAEQWRQLIEHEYRLKESETINKKVDEVSGKLDRISDGLDQNLVAINRHNQLLESILVHMESKENVRQISAFFHQRVAEGLDQPSIANVVDHENESKQDDSEENFDRLLREAFVELREFDQDSKQHQREVEELPEMHQHRTGKLNLLRADKIMSWIESDTSQLLLVNGDNVIGRYDFNSLFVVPLVLFGESNFEQVLILRHFCGDNPSFKTNNYRTLVQALVFQIFRQRPQIFRDQMQSIARSQIDDITKLWTLFVECIRKVRADCTFIIIDGIDYLPNSNTPEGFNENDFVRRSLDALVQDREMLIKILLTSKLTPEMPSSTEDQGALAVMSRSADAAPMRLSLAIIQNEMPLLPQKLIEIMERRCRSLSFSQLYMIYPVNSIIYTSSGGQLQAFIVDRLSGMEEHSNGTYGELRIRVWSVDHNGRYFTKRYQEFTISQFPGERAITQLKYIPSGHLDKEPEYRKNLIARGRRYWELGGGMHYQQVIENGEPLRIVIDQVARPFQPPSAQELEDEFQVFSPQSLKPRLLMICPPTIASYFLGDGKWRTVNVDDIHDVDFEKKLFKHLILEKQQKKTMYELVLSQIENQKSTPNQFRSREKSGITILLHGGPGTGKTFTVKCIAEKIRCPLILASIETGGSTADLEQSLKQSFHLAVRWGAILLLEDAESFLAERKDYNSIDPKATFNRVLQAIDNYSGALFLTTGRVGLLDEAVFSRIDYSARYSELSEDTNRDMWLRLLKDEAYGNLGYVERETWVEDLEGLGYLDKLNGRDIKSAILTVRQLAISAGKAPDFRTLKNLLDAKIDFTKYLAATQGGDMSKRAFERNYRDDSYRKSGRVEKKTVSSDGES